MPRWCTVWMTACVNARDVLHMFQSFRFSQHMCRTWCNSLNVLCWGLYWVASKGAEKKQPLGQSQAFLHLASLSFAPISWVSTTFHPGLLTAKPGHGKSQAGCRGIAILPHLGPGRSVGWTMAIGDPLWNLQGSHDCHSPCRGLRLGWWTRGIGWQSLLH